MSISASISDSTLFKLRPFAAQAGAFVGVTTSAAITMKPTTVILLNNLKMFTIKFSLSLMFRQAMSASYRPLLTIHHPFFFSGDFLFSQDKTNLDKKESTRQTQP
jgi:hypothetical protein